MSARPGSPPAKPLVQNVPPLGRDPRHRRRAGGRMSPHSTEREAAGLPARWAGPPLARPPLCRWRPSFPTGDPQAHPPENVCRGPRVSVRLSLPLSVVSELHRDGWESPHSRGIARLADGPRSSCRWEPRRPPSRWGYTAGEGLPSQSGRCTPAPGGPESGGQGPLRQGIRKQSFPMSAAASFPRARGGDTCPAVDERTETAWSEPAVGNIQPFHGDSCHTGPHG